MHTTLFLLKKHFWPREIEQLRSWMYLCSLSEQIPFIDTQFSNTELILYTVHSCTIGVSLYNGSLLKSNISILIKYFPP